MVAFSLAQVLARKSVADRLLYACSKDPVSSTLKVSLNASAAEFVPGTSFAPKAVPEQDHGENGHHPGVSPGSHHLSNPVQ